MRPEMSRIMEFVVGNSRWGVDIRWVREIVPVRGMTPLPNGIPPLAGVMNVRGDVVPVLDGRKVLAGAEEGGGRTVLVLVRGDEIIGLLIDAVSEIRAFDSLGKGGKGHAPATLQGRGCGHAPDLQFSAEGDTCPLIDVKKLQNMVAQSWKAKKNEEM